MFQNVRNKWNWIGFVVCLKICNNIANGKEIKFYLNINIYWCIGTNYTLHICFSFLFLYYKIKTWWLNWHYWCCVSQMIAQRAVIMFVFKCKVSISSITTIFSLYFFSNSARSGVNIAKRLLFPFYNKLLFISTLYISQ